MRRGATAALMAAVAVVALAAGCSHSASAPATSTHRSTSPTLTITAPPPPRRQLAAYLARMRPVLAAVASANDRLLRVQAATRPPLTAAHRASAVSTIDALATVYAEAALKVESAAPPAALVNATDAYGNSVSSLSDGLGLVSFGLSNPGVGGATAGLVHKLLEAETRSVLAWKAAVRQLATRERAALPGWFSG